MSRVGSGGLEGLSMTTQISLGASLPTGDAEIEV